MRMFCEKCKKECPKGENFISDDGQLLCYDCNYQEMLEKKDKPTTAAKGKL